MKDYGSIVVFPASEISSCGASSSNSTPHTTPNTALIPATPDDDPDTLSLDELTAAERAEYERGLLTWRRARRWQFWIRREWWPGYLLGVLLITGVCLVAVFHRQVVHDLMPYVKEVRHLPFGWVIPIVAIIVLSFPPLAGNEIVILLTGVVWGIRRGIAIVAVGTFLGELASFTAFSTIFRSRAGRFARKSLNYACLHKVVEEGGLFIATIVRLSAIPTHVSTVILAVCGLPYHEFIAALVLSLPKQFIAVYVGVMVMDEKADRETRIISNVVLGITLCLTLLALWYIHRQMLRVRKRVFLEMREDLARHGVIEPPPPDSDMEDCDSVASYPYRR